MFHQPTKLISIAPHPSIGQAHVQRQLAPRVGLAQGNRLPGEAGEDLAGRGVVEKTDGIDGNIVGMLLEYHGNMVGIPMEILLDISWE